MLFLLLSITLLGYLNRAVGLGTSCSSPLGAGTAASSDPFWLESIKHQGKSAYNSNPSSYTVFRNVKVISLCSFIMLCLTHLHFNSLLVLWEMACTTTRLRSSNYIGLMLMAMLLTAKNLH